MGQLEPLEHNQHVEGGEECPACVLTTDVFNAMAVELERGSRQLNNHDLAFVVALLLQSVLDAAPTEDGRISTIVSFIQHMRTFSQTEVRWLVMTEGEEAPINKGDLN